MNKPSYKAITRDAFWKKVDVGWTPPSRCFLIMKNGNQDWGYPMMGGFFDHHRQGVSHIQENIEYVLIPR